MEKNLMGYKKKFLVTDFLFYIVTMIIPIMILCGTIQTFAYIIAGVLFYGDNLQNIVLLVSQVWYLPIYLFILFLLRKFYYYEIVKKHMKEKYNFSVNSQGIEILFKNENVQISTNYIEKIHIYRYSSPFKNLYKLFCKMYMMGNMDSNFCKDITIIKVMLKDDVDLNEFERKGIYYNLFNYHKNKKTNQVSFYFYEIMYDKVSEDDICAFKEKFYDLF